MLGGVIVNKQRQVKKAVKEGYRLDQWFTPAKVQSMQRPLMTADELKSMPKGSFVVMKTGSNPMRTKLKLFFACGIRFDKHLTVEENALRPVNYASKAELEEAILKRYPNVKTEIPAPEMTPLEVNLQEQEKQQDGLITKTDK